MSIAPGRARRPGAPRQTISPDPEELAGCPFCEGREERTPPETFALAERPREPDSPGWQTRVVPNLYPAFARHEVVIHAPRHVRTLAELVEEELAALARTWAARAGAARAEGFATVQLIVNEGREAGASRAHGHSQLAWLADDPPGPRAESTRTGSCGVCEVLERDGEALAVAERAGVVLLCPAASRAPYELLVAPLAHEPEAWRSKRFETAISLLAEGIRRLRRAEGEPALNAWLHTAPFGANDGHWHLEAVPRITMLGGFELGAGVWVNILPPADAAEALRSAG